MRYSPKLLVFIRKKIQFKIDFNLVKTKQKHTLSIYSLASFLYLFIKFIKIKIRANDLVKL